MRAATIHPLEDVLRLCVDTLNPDERRPSRCAVGPAGDVLPVDIHSVGKHLRYGRAYLRVINITVNCDNAAVAGAEAVAHIRVTAPPHDLIGR